MKKMFYNLTSGKPRELIMPSIAAFLEGLTKILPAILIFEVINTIYKVFAYENEVLDVEHLWHISIIFIVWLFVEYLAAGFSYDKTYTAAYEASARGRIELADHLRKLSLGFLSEKDPGDLTTMMLTDYATVEQAISHYVPQLISGAIFPTIAFISLSFVNFKMALAMFIVMPVALIIVKISSKLLKIFGKKHVKWKVESASRLQEYLLGIREIKAHNLTGEKFKRLKKAFEELMHASIKIEGSIGPIVMLAVVLIRSGLTLMIFAGTYQLIGGTLDLPVFLGFLLIGSRVYEPITVVLTNFTELKYAILSAERVMEIRHEKALEGDKKMPSNKNIRFENVTFAYKEENILKDISFDIPAKSMTALVGLSGSGKSTITKLIARFWDINKGNIWVGDTDIREINPENLLKDISMVFQDVYLFKDTIRNNIRVGKMKATDKEIENVARLACCHEFIMNLPNGYDTVIGEGGCTLSGGEKQRISIARALLKDASIVLLDEATASLDPENEVHVQMALNELVKDKTVVIIAHRLKTIKKANQILVLDKGKIEEKGSHEMLLKKNGLYANLWKIQKESEGWHVKAS